MAAPWHDRTDHPAETSRRSPSIIKPAEGPAKSQLWCSATDTVYPSGTLADALSRLRRQAYGPGAFDMKAGRVQALFALEAMRELQAPVEKQLVFLWTSDEEIGSESSRRLIEEEAQRSEAVFVLEPSLGPRGLLKTSRKGVGEAQLIVHGRVSHAGLAPEKGINAVHELASQIGRLEKWNDLRRGLTINADIVSGGSRTNVIADRAQATLDLRAWRHADMRALEKRLHALKPVHRGAKLEILGGFDRPPLEHKHSAALFACAKTIARGLGFPLGEAGRRPPHLTRPGIPTLDGPGAAGDGAHATHEHASSTLCPSMPCSLHCCRRSK
jgi:glutamate carboxypeptidase